MPRRLIIAIALSMSSAPALADLRDKTVAITWRTSGMAKSANGLSSYSDTNTRYIYVSSAGRTFVRSYIHGGQDGGVQMNERGPEERAGVKVVGRQLIIDESFERGSRKITATFDATFQNCAVQVKDGANVRRKGLHGVIVEFESQSTSPVQCSVRTGNSFAIGNGR